jgi:hypothetical protein
MKCKIIESPDQEAKRELAKKEIQTMADETMTEAMEDAWKKWWAGIQWLGEHYGVDRLETDKKP